MEPIGGLPQDGHPRPQLTRTTWTDLSGAWDFAFDDASQGLDAGWQDRADVYPHSIMVPFPPESPASGIGQTGYHPVVWYRRTFEPAPLGAGERLLLHCGAVDYRAQVWVNGRLVATHEGGHTPFSTDITAALHDSGLQTIVIRAEDRPTDRAQPRGKQDWREAPHDIWYHRTTGIWQPVWLETVPAVHVRAIRWTPDVQRRILGLALDVARPDGARDSYSLRVQLRVRGLALADVVYAVQGDTVQGEIPLLALGDVDGADLLWSPENPALVDATLSLLVGEAVVDTAYSYAGIRSVGLAEGRFLLNGQPYYPRLVLEQGYWPETHLAAPSVEALRREVQWTKELGFNGVRLHQKVEDPRYLYWCDRLGLMVWGEMANSYAFSSLAMQRLTREWMEVLERDYSHPCIVTWVPLNESWGVPDVEHDARQRHHVQALYHLTKAFDATRPVVDNDGWHHLSSDICTIHDYAFDGAILQARYGTAEAVERTVRGREPAGRALLLAGHSRAGEPVMLTEFGGVSYAPARGEEWYGYGTVSDEAAFVAKYQDLLSTVLACPSISGFCYTQLTDTRQETNGLLTADRQAKVDPTIIRAITLGVALAPQEDVA